MSILDKQDKIFFRSRSLKNSCTWSSAHLIAQRTWHEKDCLRVNLFVVTQIISKQPLHQQYDLHHQYQHLWLAEMPVKSSSVFFPLQGWERGRRSLSYGVRRFSPCLTTTSQSLRYYAGHTFGILLLKEQELHVWVRFCCCLVHWQLVTCMLAFCLLSVGFLHFSLTDCRSSAFMAFSRIQVACLHLLLQKVTLLFWVAVKLPPVYKISVLKMGKNNYFYL